MVEYHRKCLCYDEYATVVTGRNPEARARTTIRTISLGTGSATGQPSDNRSTAKGVRAEVEAQSAESHKVIDRNSG